MKSFFWYDIPYTIAVFFLILFLHALIKQKNIFAFIYFVISFLILVITILQFKLQFGLIKVSLISGVLISLFFILLLPFLSLYICEIFAKLFFGFTILFISLSDFFHNQIVEFSSSFGLTLAIVLSCLIIVFSLIEFILKLINLIYKNANLNNFIYQNKFVMILHKTLIYLISFLIFFEIVILSINKEQSDILISFFTENNLYYNHNFYIYQIIIFSITLGFLIFNPLFENFNLKYLFISLKGFSVLAIAFALHNKFLIFLGAYVGTSGIILLSKNNYNHELK